MMSTRLREETAWPILYKLVSSSSSSSSLYRSGGVDILSSIGAVVHEEQLDVAGVLDEEGLVARGHHVTGLLVAAVADGGHGQVRLEASTDAVVDTLGLAP